MRPVGPVDYVRILPNTCACPFRIRSAAFGSGSRLQFSRSNVPPSKMPSRRGNIYGLSLDFDTLATADDDECERQKSLRGETGHVLHRSRACMKRS